MEKIMLFSTMDHNEENNKVHICALSEKDEHLVAWNQNHSSQVRVALPSS